MYQREEFRSKFQTAFRSAPTEGERNFSVSLTTILLARGGLKAKAVSVESLFSEVSTTYKLGSSGSLRTDLGAYATSCACYQNAQTVKFLSQYLLIGRKGNVHIAFYRLQKWLNVRNYLQINSFWQNINYFVEFGNSKHIKSYLLALWLVEDSLGEEENGETERKRYKAGF